MIFGVEIELYGRAQEKERRFSSPKLPFCDKITPRNLISLENMSHGEGRKSECSKINRAHERNFQKGEDDSTEKKYTNIKHRTL